MKSPSIPPTLYVGLVGILAGADDAQTTSS